MIPGWVVVLVAVVQLLLGFMIGVMWSSRRCYELFTESEQRSRELDALKIDIAMNAANMQRTAKTETRT